MRDKDPYNRFPPRRASDTSETSRMTETMNTNNNNLQAVAPPIGYRRKLVVAFDDDRSEYGFHPSDRSEFLRPARDHYGNGRVSPQISGRLNESSPTAHGYGEQQSSEPYQCRLVRAKSERQPNYSQRRTLGRSHSLEHCLDVNYFQEAKDSYADELREVGRGAYTVRTESRIPQTVRTGPVRRSGNDVIRAEVGRQPYYPQYPDPPRPQRVYNAPRPAGPPSGALRFKPPPSAQQYYDPQRRNSEPQIRSPPPATNSTLLNSSSQPQQESERYNDFGRHGYYRVNVLSRSNSEPPLREQQASSHVRADPPISVADYSYRAPPTETGKTNQYVEQRSDNAKNVSWTPELDHVMRVSAPPVMPPKNYAECTSRDYYFDAEYRSRSCDYRPPSRNDHFDQQPTTNSRVNEPEPFTKPRGYTSDQSNVPYQASVSQSQAVNQRYPSESSYANEQNSYVYNGERVDLSQSEVVSRDTSFDQSRIPYRPPLGSDYRQNLVQSTFRSNSTSQKSRETDQSAKRVVSRNPPIGRPPLIRRDQPIKQRSVIPVRPQSAQPIRTQHSEPVYPQPIRVQHSEQMACPPQTIRVPNSEQICPQPITAQQSERMYLPQPIRVQQSEQLFPPQPIRVQHSEQFRQPNTKPMNVDAPPSFEATPSPTLQEPISNDHNRSRDYFLQSRASSESRDFQTKDSSTISSENSDERQIPSKLNESKLATINRGKSLASRHLIRRASYDLKPIPGVMDDVAETPLTVRRSEASTEMMTSPVLRSQPVRDRPTGTLEARKVEETPEKKDDEKPSLSQVTSLSSECLDKLDGSGMKTKRSRRSRAHPRRHTLTAPIELPPSEPQRYHSLDALNDPELEDKRIANGHVPAQRPVSIGAAPINHYATLVSRRRSCDQDVKRLSYDGEDRGAMSDLDSSHDSSFNRGARIRTTLPIVRTQSRSKEKPLGVVFLVFRNETKRAVLPNEITCIDTVKALFVRSFSKSISFDFLESDLRKIYLFDEEKNLFYELENVKDIVDRTILKVQEFGEDGQPIQSQLSNGNLTGCDVRALLESRATPCPTQPPPSPQSRPIYNNGHAPQRVSPYRAGTTSQPQSPQRVPRTVPGLTVPVSSQRHSVAYGGSSEPLHSSFHSDQGCHSGQSTPRYDDAGHRLAKMEVQLATLTAWVQQSAPSAERPHSTISMHSDTSGHSSNVSECSSVTPTPMCAQQIHASLSQLHSKARGLSAECKELKKLQMRNNEAMREFFYETSKHLQKVMSVVPGADELPLRGERLHVNTLYKSYQHDSYKVERQLGDLESAVEDLREDVINRKCRVQGGEVEAMALSLSQISRCLADFKNAFPLLMNRMKSVMASEMEVVVNEEKFIREEPERIDINLRRCKKITGVLFTMKKLGDVQESKPPVAPVLAVNRSPKDADKRAVLDGIQSIVPDHEARVQSMQAAEALREKKKNINSNSETLKFEKSLEMASKGLKVTDQSRERKLSDSSKKEKTKEKCKESKPKEKDVKKKELSEKELKKQRKEQEKFEKERQKQLEKERKKAEKTKNRKPSPNEKHRKSIDAEQVSLDSARGIEPSPEPENKSNLKELEVTNAQPPSVERIRVASGPMTSSAPVPKLSSFAAPTSPYETFCSNYSKLLASNPRYEQIYSRPRTVIDTMNLSESPMTSRSDSPKSNTMENPYAVGRPRPASISGPIPELDALYAQSKEPMSFSMHADENLYDECSLEGEPLYAQVQGKRKVPPPPPPRKYKSNGEESFTEPNTPTAPTSTSTFTPPSNHVNNNNNNNGRANYENIQTMTPEQLQQQYGHARSISEPAAPNADPKALRRFENNVMQGLVANLQGQKAVSPESANGKEPMKQAPPKGTMTLHRHERSRAQSDSSQRDAEDRLANTQLHEQYWKLQRLQQQQHIKETTTTTTTTSSFKGKETSPIITRSKVVVNEKTGRHEEETDIF